MAKTEADNIARQPKGWDTHAHRLNLPLSVPEVH